MFVYSRPQDGLYTLVEKRGRGDLLRPTKLSDVALSVSKVLGGR